ncbi:discoidin domain-containing protein [Cytophagaceae bacterium ABcell3]|nr:discoidin domain-containing protein [Cytophagaceae bacterium ABcell3]
MKPNNLKFFFVIMLLSTTGIFTQCKKKEKDQLPSSSDKLSVQQVETSCTHTISANETILDGSEFEPGSVICIEGGRRGALLLRNFNGTSAEPIVFINKGKVEFKLNSNNAYGIKTEECAFLKFSGSGSPEYERGIEIDGPHIGMAIERMSTNIEIEFMEIHNIGFAGIMAKTDPSCDPATWRENFTMKDLRIHDCHIYETKGEGIYVGNSFYVNGRNLGCGSILPHAIHGVRVYNNKVWNSGWEGIQVGCATEDCEIYNNSVENYGLTNTRAQNNGIQIGEGTSGKMYNNIIRKGTGNGLIVLARGNNYIYNNIIIDAGDLGIFCDARGSLPNSEFAFINNTIINPKTAGIWQYSTTTKNTFYNNIVAGTTSFTHYRSGAEADEQNNLFLENAADVKFTSLSTRDFSLKAESPAVDGGKDVSSYGINFDFENNRRPYGNGYDIGAYEFNSGSGFPDDEVAVPAPGEVVGDVKVSASSYQEPYRPENTLDGNLQTRWAASGVGAWIKYEFQNVQNVNTVSIAFFEGEKHQYAFDIEVSMDDVNWISVYTGQSSGTSGEVESFSFPDAQAKFVRITGKGSNDNNWNSFTSVKISDEDEMSQPPLPGEPKDSLNAEPEKPSFAFETTNDLFIDANNRALNNNFLQVGPGRNTVYLMFDVDNVDLSKIKKAKLQLQVTDNRGGGVINISNGSHSNWDENTLEFSRRPLGTNVVARHNTRQGKAGDVIEVDVSNAITQEGAYTFVIELENTVGVRQISFSSKEGSFAPKLVLE